jgi:lipopolysaccharide/colanic/teichoic acid biosynthesis glycosyltransferase
MEGACKFAVEVEKEIPEKFSSPQYTIFNYPDHWIENDKSGDKKTKDKECAGDSNIINIENIQPFSFISFHFKKKWVTTKNKIQDVFIRKIPWWKRLIDIILSSMALLVLTPLFLMVSGLITIVSPGPVFFKQKRIGYKGKIFTMFKFRTMKVNNNDTVHKEYAKQFIKSDQKLVKLDNKNDTRIIPGGRFLRKACIDELPQLINVLRGEMSIVGPRPPIPYEVDEYDNWHIKRFDVMPGLTGLWQVSGKQKLTFSQMIRMDIRYRNKLSFLFDLFIMIKTVPTILGMIFDAALKKMTTIKE